MAKRIFDALFTAITLLLAIPTILILVSWNAIPGDKMYPLKSGLEDAVILVFSGTPLIPEVSMKFTDRRLSEATSLLSKEGSSVGYDLLVAEAKQTQVYIAKKSDIQTGDQFNKNIDEYKKEIEKKKIEVRAEIQTNSAAQNAVTTTTNVPVPLQTVSVKIPQTSTTQTTGQVVVVNKPEVVVIHEEDPVEVLQKLEDTEIKLEVIQQEVVRETQRTRTAKERGRKNGPNDSSNPAPTPIPTDFPNTNNPGE